MPSGKASFGPLLSRYYGRIIEGHLRGTTWTEFELLIQDFLRNGGGNNFDTTFPP